MRRFLSCMAVLIGALAARADLTVLGILDRKLFLQECWHEGKPYYIIANLEDEEITVSVTAPDGTKAGPWKIGARESKNCPVPIVKNPGKDDYMTVYKDGHEIGILRPPSKENLPKDKGYATNKNYNRGGDPDLLWMVQTQSTYEGGDVVEITFVVKAPNPKGKDREYNVTGFDLSRVEPKNYRAEFGQVLLPAVEVTSETLTIEKDKEKFTVKVENPKKDAEWHRVTARFAAPKVRTLKAGVVVGEWWGDHGGGKRWLLRSVVLVPKAAKEKAGENGQAGSEKAKDTSRQYSKPVRVGGVDFELAAETVWRRPAEVYGVGEANVGLRISNRSDKDFTFDLGDNLRVSLKPADGPELVSGFVPKRCLPKPLKVAAGKSETVTLPTHLFHTRIGQVFLGLDSGAGWDWLTREVLPGKYRLCLSFENKQKGNDAWLGKMQTEALEIEVKAAK